MLVRCKKCNSYVLDSAEFCPYCHAPIHGSGTTVKEAVQEIVATTPVGVMEDVSPDVDIQQNEQKNLQIPVNCDVIDFETIESGQKQNNNRNYRRRNDVKDEQNTVRYTGSGRETISKEDVEKAFPPPTIGNMSSSMAETNEPCEDELLETVYPRKTITVKQTENSVQKKSVAETKQDVVESIQDPGYTTTSQKEIVEPVIEEILGTEQFSSDNVEHHGGYNSYTENLKMAPKEINMPTVEELLSLVDKLGISTPEIDQNLISDSEISTSEEIDKVIGAYETANTETNKEIQETSIPDSAMVPGVAKDTETEENIAELLVETSHVPEEIINEIGTSENANTETNEELKEPIVQQVAPNQIIVSEPETVKNTAGAFEQLQPEQEILRESHKDEIPIPLLKELQSKPKTKAEKRKLPIRKLPVAWVEIDEESLAAITTPKKVFSTVAPTEMLPGDEQLSNMPVPTPIHMSVEEVPQGISEAQQNAVAHALRASGREQILETKNVEKNVTTKKQVFYTTEEEFLKTIIRTQEDKLPPPTTMIRRSTPFPAEGIVTEGTEMDDGSPKEDPEHPHGERRRNPFAPVAEEEQEDSL